MTNSNILCKPPLTLHQHAPPYGRLAGFRPQCTCTLLVWPPMKTLLPYRPLCALILASLVGAAQAQTATLNILGLEDMSCKAWQEGAKDEALRAQQMAWLRGLLTGHNYAHPKEQVSVVSNGTIENFITRFCKDNPQGNYTDGGLRMSDLYSGRNRPIAR